MTINSGYNKANLDDVLKRAKSVADDITNQSKNVLTSSFNPNDTTGIDITPDVDSSERLDVTHFMGNQMSFHVPPLNPVPKLDVGKPAPEPEDPSVHIQANAGVKQDYLAANQRIQTEMLEAIENVPDGGKELASSMRGAMPQPGSSSIFALGTMAVEQAAGLGAVGNFYAAMNAISANSKNRSVMSDESAAIFDKAMQGLMASNEQKTKAYKQNPAMNQPPLDLSSLKSGQQMRDFLLRDVTQDPIMQELERNEEITNQMAENVRLYEDVYPINATPEKAMFALKSGDEDMLRKLMKDDVKVELMKKGKVEEAFKEPAVASAAEAKMFTEALKDTKAPVKSADITAIGASAKEVLASLQNEPDMKALLARRNDFNLTAA